MTDELTINLADDITVRQLQSDGEAVLTYSEDILVKARSGQEVSVELTHQGPQGPQGPMGNVTQEMLDVLSDATAAAGDANTAKTGAIDAKNAAEAASGASAQSATNSQTSATASDQARAAAVTAKTAAETAQTGAQTAKTGADTAKTGAETAKTGAETARTGAETAKTAAETAKTGAETARTNAQAAQTAAELARDTILGSVSDAEAQALAAAQSAADALASETAADTSAIASDASADASAASAAAALASKNAAATSETNAAGSATNAAAAKVGSETARDASVAARTASETARDASIQAKTDAQTAKTGAEAAQLASETARDASVTAKTGAEAAKAGAETARDEAVAAVDQINTGVLDQFVLKADNGSDFADPAQVLTTIGGQPLLTPVTQLEAEAGTLTVERSWTPKRVADAITYRIPSSYTIGAITGLQGALDLKAPLASPALSGTPTAPTAALATNTTQIATTAFVKIAIDDLKVGAPALYDTLAEIGTWLQNNDTELASSIATKAPLASPSFTGVVTTTGEFRTTSQNFLRAVQGNFGLLGRMDASDFYFLMTASGDQYGSYNGLRPFAINMTTGKVTIGNGLQSNTDILVGTGGTRLQPDGNLYMTWAGDWLSNVLNGKITTNGRAYPRNSSGGDINFFWSGQAGQPSWVWGGGDGTNMYVYNPSNFSVAYAANAGAISGVAVGSIVQFTVSSDPNEVNYPIGQILGVWNNASIRPRNEANTLRVYSGDTADWSLSSLGTGAVLAGTWRAKGVCSNDRQLFQRVA